MKRITYTLSLVFILFQDSYAQFLGGGTGTEEAPFRIYTIEHFNQFADTFNIQTSSYGNFTGMHVRLMNDITDTIRTGLYAMTNIGIDGYPDMIGFDGYFHGGGHSLVIDLDTNTVNIYEDYFIGILYENGKIDSLTFLGTPKNFSSLIGTNWGVISHVHSKLVLTPPLRQHWILAVICTTNEGVIEYCKNYSNLANTFLPSIGLPDRYILSGICHQNIGLIRYCSNYGNISLKDGLAAGIVAEGGEIVEYCINTGNISSVNTLDGGGGFNVGICGWSNLVRNCINTGNINYFNGPLSAAGITGASGVSPDGIANSVSNCFNSGEINGYLDFTQNIITGSGIVGISAGGIVNNNLNIANCKKSAVVDSMTTGLPFVGSNNYYDKQMCRVKGISPTQDLPNQTIGKLTSELTGTSIALQNMLGNGWSYAEGRYPIPLGLENDSVALVAATPIYLYAENNLSYDHIDSVAHHFPVGLENNVTWDNANNIINIPSDSAFLQTTGVEILTASIDQNYPKKIKLHVVGIPSVESPTIPEAPTTLVAVANSSPLSVTLNWTDNASNEIGYKVQRSLNGIDFTQIQSLGENIATTIDNNVNFATTYYYRVFAYNSEGDSDFSNIAEVTTIEVGIDEFAPRIAALYPNPANAEVTIELRNINAKSKIAVLNVLGQTVMQKEITDGKTTLDIEPLSSGTYIIQFENSYSKFIKE